MKRFLSYAILVVMALAITSCSGEKRKKALLPNISGHAGEVIVVIDKGDWEGAVGTTLRDTLGQDCKFLPQREPLYSLVNITLILHIRNRGHTYRTGYLFVLWYLWYLHF